MEPGVWRRFQAPYNKSVSRVSAGQTWSVLHHIHQRLGLRARRLLAGSSHLPKWVKQQLKPVITTGKTISNNRQGQLQGFVGFLRASHISAVLCWLQLTDLPRLPTTVGNDPKDANPDAKVPRRYDTAGKYQWSLLHGYHNLIINNQIILSL